MTDLSVAATQCINDGEVAKRAWARTLDMAANGETLTLILLDGRLAVFERCFVGTIDEFMTWDVVRSERVALEKLNDEYATFSLAGLYFERHRVSEQDWSKYPRCAEAHEQRRRLAALDVELTRRTAGGEA